MPSVLPIAPQEFIQSLRRCMPPRGWPAGFAIANSGGPDSTCLLYLLRHALFNDSTNDFIPLQQRDLHSISVDHSLQPNSAAMSAQAANNAKALGVKHVTERIPWSTPPFPPTPVSAVETTAREARYYLLTNAMRANALHVLAVGHHADDQLETVLMRLERNGRSALHDMSGMKPVRRWGMGRGSPGSVGFIGEHGMNRWIIRPLLDFRKDQILATCDAHGLEYVTDKTNFQPNLTPRNALRQELSQMASAVRQAEGTGSARENVSPKEPSSQTHSTAERVKQTLRRGYTAETRDLLQRALQQSELLEQQAIEYIARWKTTSPISTFAFSPDSELPPPALRERIVLRILRYVSPRAWGSPEAEADRSSESIQRIANVIWRDPRRKKGKETDPSAFTAGGQVLWTKAAFPKKGGVAFRTAGPGEVMGWIASRQPPFYKNRQVEASLGANITERLRSAAEAQQSRLRVLWDCRFILNFDVRETCEALQLANNTQVQIMAHSRWFLPALHVSGNGMETTVLLGRLDAAVKEPTWVRTRFIREL